MAKLALINRNEKRRKTVKKFTAKRAELFAIANDPTRHRGGRRTPPRQAAEAAARRVAGARAQSLRAHRAGRAARTASSASGATSCARSRCAAKIPGVIKASW